MKKYRSNVHSPRILKMLGIAFVFLVGATVIGQIKGDRFPTFYDIGMVSLFPFGLYVFLWLIALLMPITVKSHSIKCYNVLGIYKVAKWPDIEDVYLSKIYGLPYACLEVKGLSMPITVPLYLSNMKDFRAHVIENAGVDNLFSRFLSSET